MSNESTPRLQLPQLVSMQEMNNVTWNESLAQLDALIDLCLLGQYVNTPPSSPADGDAYLVGGAPTGAWTGYAYKIASCLDGAWRFYTPFNGLRAYVATTGAFIVYVNGTWTDWNSLISANEVSIASAATCDLGAAGSLFVQITGTTTITSFGTGANKLRFVRFAGALTLTHNATSLILLGGASRTTAAGDVGVYASDASGNWRERDYQRAASDPGDRATKSGAETLTNKTLGATNLPGSGSLDGSGRLLLPGQPLFQAYLSAIVSNLSGDGTDATIVFDATTINQGGAFNASTGKFTAPVAGRYQFGGAALISNLSSSHTIGWLQALVSGVKIYSSGLNPYVCMRSDGYLGLVLAPFIVNMAAGDTAELKLHIAGGSKTAGLFGGGLGSGLNTYFSGHLLAA